MTDAVRRAYSRRAAEYAELFGSMAPVHPSDRQVVTTWAGTIDGNVIDAGCGPGQWTSFLSELGLSVSGVDLVPEFIDHARAAHPGIAFTVGSVDSLDVGTGTLGGVLSWYSLIHHDPDAIRSPLREFGRVLRPGGGVLIGFFEGPAVERFDHAVVPAYRWPVRSLAHELEAVGFDVVETHTRTTTGQRPNAVIIARRADDRP